MNIKQHILTAYRSVSFVALVALFFGIIWYAVGFILMSGGLSNWSVPIVLSPTQERVLTFQPQVAALEASYLRQKVELTTAKAKIIAGEDQLNRINHLLRRIDGAQRTESAALAVTNKAIVGVLRDKTFNIGETDRLIADTKTMLATVDDEERSKLITKDQASQRRITLQNALNQATDAKAQFIALSEQERQSRAAIGTFGGGGTSLQALQSLQTEQQLRMVGVQLQIEVETNRDVVVAITKNISELERVLDTAKEAPQYRALREKVHVLFAPYTSIESAKVGDGIYDCYLMYLACRQVGTITKVYEAEEYARHPFLKTDLKGHLVEVNYTVPAAAMSQVVFISGKPLFL